MSQEESTVARSSRPRSRFASKRDQPTIAQLEGFGVKVRDFAYESTLPPVRTVYRQPRQIQPSVPRPLHREDTEPLDDIPKCQLPEQDTEPVLKNPIAREHGGFLESNGSSDRIVNSLPSCLHPETPEYSQLMQPLIDSQETGMVIPTPTVTPNGSLQWTEPPTLFEHDMPQPALSIHLYRSLSGFSSPLTPLPPSPPIRQRSNRSPSMASLEEPSSKRRKISMDNINLRPGLKRYYLRKRPIISPNKRLNSSRPLKSVKSDHSRRKNDIESSSSTFNTHDSRKGQRS